MTDDRIMAAFAREGLSPRHWSNAAGDVYAAHSHAHHKVLYCLSGSITFRILDDGEEIELFAGDRLDIEAETAHAAVVGREGVTCAEAARTTG
jgi:quercetin dioxygenase-like cupin family protein